MDIANQSFYDSPRKYRAFDTKSADTTSAQIALKLELLNGNVEILSYSFLQRISGDSKRMLLLYTHCGVDIEGRNLQRLYPDLQSQSTSAIRQYREEFDRPAEHQPIVELIKVYTKEEEIEESADADKPD